MARTPKKGTTTAVSINPSMAYTFLSPANCPMAKGKIKFPAPKNIENRANPEDIDFDFNKLLIKQPADRLKKDLTN